MDTTMAATASTLVPEWLHWLEHRKGRSPLTVRRFSHSLGSFVERFGQRDLTGLTPEEVEDWAWRPRRHGEPARATVHADIAAVKSFLQWCEDRHDIRSRARRLIVDVKISEGVPRPVPDDVWRQAWLSSLYDDDRVWLGLCYFGGLRRMEVMTLAPEAVDAAMGTLTFDRKGAKQARIQFAKAAQLVGIALPHVGERWDEWLDLVYQLARSRRGETYLSPFSLGDVVLDPQRLNKRLRRLLRRADLPPDAFTPHQLRHSCATNLFRAGCDSAFVSNYLSHANMKQTRVYMDTTTHLDALIAGRGDNHG